MTEPLTWAKLRADTRAALDKVGMPRPSSFGGIRIVESPLLVERVLHAKSPSRAKRREKLGHPQHYITVPSSKAYFLPDGTAVMHPAMVVNLKATIHG